MLSQQRKREILEAIALRHGGLLRPEDIVAEATNPTHELHGEFEWDDAVAATAHRLEQARVLVRSVRVQITTERRVLDAPYFVPAPDAPLGGYLALPTIRDDAAIARDTVTAEFARAAAALRRARDIGIALGIDGRVDEIVRQIEQLGGELPTLRAVV